MMSLLALVKGFGLGAGLIVAIGAQNAFVLSCALRNQHVWVVALVCMWVDICLITAGIWGLGAVVRMNPGLMSLATWGGAAFLLVYGFFAFRRAFTADSLKAQSLQTMTLRAAVATTLALSLLNPHVYLDTVVLLGSIGGQLPGHQPGWFALGAALASISWFSLLAWGGKRLAPWFATAKNWQRLDFGVGLTMWCIALSLLLK